MRLTPQFLRAQWRAVDAIPASAFWCL